MSDETHDLFEPPLMSEIGEAQSYLDINRRIVRNTVAVNYLGLAALRCRSAAIHCARVDGREAFCARRRAGARLRCPSCLEPRQYSRRDTPRS
jgi:hypothetical protein